MKRLSVLLVLLMMLFAAGCGDGGSKSPLTKKNYDKIKLGMKYTEAVKIMGSEGVKRAGSSTDEVAYRWEEKTKEGYPKTLEVSVGKDGDIKSKMANNLDK